MSAFSHHKRGSMTPQRRARIFDANGRMQIPVAGLTALMLEPGTRISHAAVTLTDGLVDAILDDRGPQS